jgi:hypothetical protein
MIEWWYNIYIYLYDIITSELLPLSISSQYLREHKLREDKFTPRLTIILDLEIVKSVSYKENRWC